MARKHSIRDFQQGNRFHQHGNITAALVAYRRYISRNPLDKSGHFNLAVTLAAAHQPEAAVLSYCRALEIDPWYPEALNNLGILLHSQRNLVAAKQCYARALASCPGYDDAEYNLATLESNSGNYQQAIFHFSRILERNPQRADAWNNLGNALLALRAPADALQAFQLALDLQSEFPNARWNSSVAQLTLGRLPEGWNGFELRGQLRHSTLPRWDGSNIAGRQILVHAEQGMGDTIQFSRYCGQVKEYGAHVILECHSELIPLLQTVSGIDTFVEFGTPLPCPDVQIPLMSLPRVFGTTLKDLSGTTPYLTANPDLITKWRARLDQPVRNLKVGLVWAGNPKHQNDHNRSIPPGLLGELGRPENVSLFSLQQKPQSECGSPIQFAGIFDELTFSDTAAIIANLDLVISVDTAVAHLAGALGRPVWTLLPFAPDWRWMLERSDTPWYPTMRLFRQPQLDDWPSVLRRVGSELKLLAKTT